MIKIACIVPYQIIPPETGGHRGIYLFYQALSRYAEVTCFTVKENTAWKNENIRIIPILGSTKSKLRYINPLLVSKIKKYCKSQGIPILVSEHPYFGWLTYALKKLTGMPYAIHSYNIESMRFKTIGKAWWPILFLYEKFSHRHADANFFITQEDREYAIRHFGLQTDRCFVATYGIEQDGPPGIDKQGARQEICKTYGFDPSTLLLLFNGSLNYSPNENAVKKIIHNINPVLRSEMKVPYKIIICGKADPELMDVLKTIKKEGVIYTGFVPDIRPYFLAADVFLNPVTEGGGIKTKLVEALAADTPAVSFKSGAWGVPVSVTGETLKIVDDDDFEGFAEAVKQITSGSSLHIPGIFFEHFNQQNIARNVAEVLEEMVSDQRRRLRG